MKKVFTLLTLLLCAVTSSWGADATPTYPQPSVTLDLQAEGLSTTLSSITWKSRNSNHSYAYELTSDYLIFPIHTLAYTTPNFCTKENLNNDGQSWDASTPFKASSYFFSSNSNNVMKATTTRNVAVKVTNCTEVKLYAETNVTLNVYEPTNTSDPYNTFTLVGTQTTTSTSIKTISSLDASKTYIVQVVGSTSTNAKVYAIALKRAAVTNKPTITTQPQSASYETGDAISALTVAATASAGDLSYQWYSCDDAEKTNPQTVGTNSNSYTPSGAGYYYCTVTDSKGSINSAVATVTVVNAFTPEISYATPAVTITYTGSGKVYYTTDGSVPSSSNGTEYSAPFNLTNSCTVRAVAEKGGNSSDLVKYDCYVDQSSAEGFLISTGNHSGTNSGSTWSSNDGNFTLSKTSGDFNWSNGLFPGMHGHKMDNGTTYTLQPIESIKITSIKIVGRTWLTGTAATVAVSDATPSSDTWLAGETGHVSYILTKEFAISADYGEAVTITPTGNQFGCFLEVYGDIKTYTITYDKGTYGTGTTIAAGEKTYGTAFTLSSSTFTRDGFVQTGWATYDGGPQNYALGGSYTANADVTLYPVWAKVASVTAFNNTDGKTISQLEALGWTFNSAVFDGDPADTEAYVNLVSAFTTAGLTAPGTNSMDANAIAFAKNTSAYAMYDLGAAKTVTAVNATLYGGSSSSFNATIEYIGADGSTVKKSYSTIALNAGNWQANNVSLTDEVSGVRYIKVYGASKWMIMYNLSVTYKESVSVGTKSGRNYASYVTSEKLDFGSAEGITAYIATGLNTGKTAVEMTPVSVVPAGTPIIVKTDTKGAIINVPVTTADVSDTSSNLLVAGNGSSIGGEGKYDYILSGDMFYRASEGVLAVGKAYLHFDTAPARELSLIFEDEEATGIRSVDNGKVTIDNAIYDLSGRRVANPTKGLYIVNGKKVILK